MTADSLLTEGSFDRRTLSRIYIQESGDLLVTDLWKETQLVLSRVMEDQNESKD